MGILTEWNGLMVYQSVMDLCAISSASVNTGLLKWGLKTFSHSNGHSEALTFFGRIQITVALTTSSSYWVIHFISP